MSDDAEKQYEQRFTLELPRPRTNPVEWLTVKSDGPIVVVGANGSGKTRLGWKIEESGSPQSDRTHRIAAQRALQMPELCRPTSIDEAVAGLRYGYQKGNISHKHGHRWGSHPATHLLNDYEALMTSLLSDEWAISTKYRKDARICGGVIQSPDAKLDVLERIWEKTLPYRRLVISSGKVEAAALQDDATPYAGNEMSDGERVIFYLIGQALLAPRDGILIIDEPEIHIHKAVLTRLWDNIEAERPDCLFVYLTHDPDFAASRRGGKKICLRDYDGQTWDWVEVRSGGELPEDVLLQILGSRKPILFVEGDKNSVDFEVYRQVYANYTVVPRGSAEAVVHSTASFSKLTDWHRLDCYGIVDRDLKNQDDVENLAKLNVHVLLVAEIENLFLTEEVLRVAASRLKFTDTDELVEKEKAIVLEKLREDKERVISAIAASEVGKRLRYFDSKAVGAQSLKTSIEKLTASLDVDAIYDEATVRIQTVLEKADYSGALSLFLNKGLLPAVAPVFGYKDRGFCDLVLRLVADKDNADVLDALRRYLPVLPVPVTPSPQATEAPPSRQPYTPAPPSSRS